MYVTLFKSTETRQIIERKLQMFSTPKKNNYPFMLSKFFI